MTPTPKKKFTAERVKMDCDPSTTTIEEAKRWLREQTAKGGECPCCRQRVQFYNRPLTTSMAYVLILIDRYCQAHSDWLHVPSHLSKLGVGEAARGGDWAKMVHWGLIEQRPGARKDKSDRTGFWRVTPLGHAFVVGDVRVPRHVLMYDGKPVKNGDGRRREERTVSIHEAIGKRFDYERLMQGRL